ncbi:MAG TPA: hypothetical protein VGQ13_00680 [Nitrososphaera sp.]|nr:hypothetical protein [Nitrososphaera sp.]
MSSPILHTGINAADNVVFLRHAAIVFLHPRGSCSADTAFPRDAGHHDLHLVRK